MNHQSFEVVRTHTQQVLVSSVVPICLYWFTITFESLLHVFVIHLLIIVTYIKTVSPIRSHLYGDKCDLVCICHV